MNFKSLLALPVLLITCLYAHATHIVGGEINYRYLGNDNYEIRMSIYFDCINGSPAAIYSDSISTIGFFNQANNLVASVAVNWSDPQYLNTLNYNCVQFPPNVCVLFYSFIDTVNLPNIPGGYQVVYQRCCRNNTILNVVNPSSTGATFYAFIPDTNQTGTNSNPRFNNLPPVVLCNNVPLTFDHSATDDDGDSLVYHLCTPLDGADQFQPQPIPPNPPPYNNISFQTGYNAGNMMGTNPPLTINPQTGILTVTPLQIGQYVVGICVDEYRNGVLISTTRRDYQFNVIACNFDVISAFTAPTYNCSNTIQFNNSSQGADAYFWDFGDPNTTTDTSSQATPTYTYPGPGDYTITLIALDSNCSDTVTVVLTILPDIFLNAELDTSICIGDAIIIGEPDMGPYPATYQWTPGLYLSNDTIQNPETSPPVTFEWVVEKTIGNCSQYDTVKVTVLFPPDTIPFSAQFLPVCEGIQVIGTSSGYPADSVSISLDSLQYQGLSTAVPPDHTFPFSDTITSVVYVKNGNCPGQFDTIMILPEKPQFLKDPLPNVFTPNGDGINECFDLAFNSGAQNPGLNCFSVEIYNRWGLKIYSSSSGGCWDGTNSDGVKVTDGVYYFIVNDGENEHQGFVSVITQSP